LAELAMRTVLGVVLGYLLFSLSAVLLFQLTKREPHAAASLGFAFVATFYGIAFAFLGGYLAARLARRPDLLAATLVAALIALGATISLVATWRQAAHWSQWTAIFFMAPAAALGGRIAKRRTS
jgi:surface polysaccharide O-acyltransferase-like enzyme